MTQVAPVSVTIGVIRTTVGEVDMSKSAAEVRATVAALLVDACFALRSDAPGSIDDVLAQRRLPLPSDWADRISDILEDDGSFEPPEWMRARELVCAQLRQWGAQ